MDSHDRDRRDSPGAEDETASSADQPEPAPIDREAPPDETVREPAGTMAWTEPMEPSRPLEPSEPVASTGPAETPATSEIESWPSQDASAAPPEPTTPPAWPTEPPVAGSAAADAWPTEAPARGDEPIVEPEWSTAAERESQPVAAEPPPSEVEAYPAPSADPAAGVAAAHAVPASEGAIGESTQCPRCGTENRPGLAFCRDCGQRLVAAGVTSTVERPGTPEGTMACPRCGTHNRAGVAFCQNCGANLRGTAPGYVPPVAATEPGSSTVEVERRGAVLGPVVLLIGLAGIVTGYLLPFLYGSGSLFDRAWGANGHGAAFWAGYPEVGANLADQAYFGLAGPIPILGVILLTLAIAGFMRAVPGTLQTIGLGITLLWSVGLIVLFVVVELAGNWTGDLVAMLRVLTPAGIIFFLASLILLIGSLTRFARS